MGTHESVLAIHPIVAVPKGERELVEELRAGSVEAFNQLIGLYQQPLYRFLYRMVGDPNDTADILQDVFVKIFRSAAAFQGKSSLKTWIYQIAMHEASNHRRWWRRHAAKETSLDEPAKEGMDWRERLADGSASPLEQALRQELNGQLRALLRAVPEPYHSALLLREVEGFSYEEMAEILQVRVGTVKSRLLRGREYLRRALLSNPGAAQLCAAWQEGI